MMHCINNHNSILILAEHKDGEIDSLTFQLAARGREMADKLGCKLNVVLIGYSLEKPLEQLTQKGFDTVYAVDDRDLENYHFEVYKNVLLETLQKDMPSMFLLGYTYLGMEMGPAVATSLEIPLVSNCTGLDLADGHIILTRPMFGGKVYASLEARNLPLVISVQKGSLPLKASATGTAVLRRISPGDGIKLARTKIVELIERATGGIDITKAEVLVSVGRGIGEKSGIELIQNLADRLKGSIACSRPLADCGWLPRECHVGISGRSVRPKLYIACGISGAAQHLDGIRDSRTIIAINKDPDAPIFRTANYGIVGDIYEIVPALLNAIAANPL